VIVEVSIHLGYDTVSPGNWFPRFWGHHSFSKCQEPFTQLHGVISLKNGYFSFTTAKT